MAAKNLITFCLAFSLIPVIYAQTPTAETLACTSEFVHHVDKAWMKAFNGEVTQEVGFRVRFIDGAVIYSDATRGDNGWRSITTAVTNDTIAIFHTHPNKAGPFPSPEDMESPVPNFVFSKKGLFVTIPGTKTFKQLGSCPKQ